LAVKGLPEAASPLGQLIFAQPALVEGDFLEAGDHQSLTLLDGVHKGRSIK
jgi:hypothetical protein